MYLSACVDASKSLKRRVACAQIILRLLPAPNFSLLVYLVAFFSQVPLFPENRLTLEAVSVIFGPALMSARNLSAAAKLQKLVSNGPMTITGPTEGYEMVGVTVKKSQDGLLWLLSNWSAVADGLLEPDFDLDTDEILNRPSPSTDIAVTPIVRPQPKFPVELSPASSPIGNHPLGESAPASASTLKITVDGDDPTELRPFSLTSRQSSPLVTDAISPNSSPNLPSAPLPASPEATSSKAPLKDFFPTESFNASFTPSLEQQRGTSVEVRLSPIPPASHDQGSGSDKDSSSTPDMPTSGSERSSDSSALSLVMGRVGRGTREPLFHEMDGMSKRRSPAQEVGFARPAPEDEFGEFYFFHRANEETSG